MSDLRAPACSVTQPGARVENCGGARAREHSKPFVRRLWTELVAAVRACAWRRDGAPPAPRCIRYLIDSQGASPTLRRAGRLRVRRNGRPRRPSIGGHGPPALARRREHDKQARLAQQHLVTRFHRHSSGGGIFPVANLHGAHGSRRVTSSRLLNKKMMPRRPPPSCAESRSTSTPLTHVTITHCRTLAPYCCAATSPIKSPAPACGRRRVRAGRVVLEHAALGEQHRLLVEDDGVQPVRHRQHRRRAVEVVGSSAVRPSVSWSTLAVASSITSTDDRRSSARAMHTGGARAAEKFEPPLRHVGVEPARQRAHTLVEARAPQRVPQPRVARVPAALALIGGGREVVRRIVPRKRVGSCWMIERRERAARASGTRVWSTPSIVIRPPDSSTMRKSATASDDLPAPVRPTTPTRVRGAIEKESDEKTGRSPTRTSSRRPRDDRAVGRATRRRAARRRRRIVRRRG